MKEFKVKQIRFTSIGFTLMDKHDLYSLSKDQLVDLVSTIQHDLSVQLKNSETIFSTIRETSKYVSIDRCSYKGCHRFCYWEEFWNGRKYDIIDFYNDGRITFCNCLADKCECEHDADKGIGWWCKQHVPREFHIEEFRSGFGFTCERCIKEQHHISDSNDD